MRKLLATIVAVGIVCPVLGQEPSALEQMPAQAEMTEETAGTQALPAETMVESEDSTGMTVEEAEDAEKPVETTGEQPMAQVDEPVGAAEEPADAATEPAEQVQEPDEKAKEDTRKKVKLEVKPYGFVKGDMYLTNNHGALSYGKPSMTCVNAATDGNGAGGIQFTAQHSRFGLTGTVEVKEIEVGAKVELDFWVIAADANAKPRMRLAYGWVKPLTGLSVLIGQQWDMFSPLNPTTNNTNANLWFNGNYGFRRPQFRVEYIAPLETVKPGIQFSIGEATKEPGLSISSGAKSADSSEEVSDKWLGSDNLSGLPMFQGRAYVVVPLGITVGLSAVYAAYGEDRDVTTWGISADATLPLHKLISLKGEFAYGSNLHNGDLLTIGGAGGAGDNAVTTNGGWLNVISSPLSWLTLVGGYGVENVRTSTAPGSPKANLTFYGDAIFTIGKYFSFTVEGQRIITSYGGNDATVNVLDISGKVAF